MVSRDAMDGCELSQLSIYLSYYSGIHLGNYKGEGTNNQIKPTLCPETLVVFEIPEGLQPLQIRVRTGRITRTPTQGPERLSRVPQVGNPLILSGREGGIGQPGFTLAGFDKHQSHGGMAGWVRGSTQGRAKGDE